MVDEEVARLGCRGHAQEVHDPLACLPRDGLVGESAPGPEVRGGRSGRPARRGRRQRRSLTRPDRRGTARRTCAGRHPQPQRAADRGRILRRDGGQPSRATCLPLADVEADQRCGREQGHVLVGVIEHALHPGRDRRRASAGRSRRRARGPAPGVPARGLCSSASTCSETSRPASTRASSAACTSCGSALASSWLTAACDAASSMRSATGSHALLDEHVAEVDAVLAEGEPRRSQPHGREQQRDNDDRGDVEPDHVEHDQQDAHEPERERHAGSLDHGLGAHAFVRLERLVRRVDRGAGRAVGERDVGDRLGTHQTEEEQRRRPDARSRRPSSHRAARARRADWPPGRSRSRNGSAAQPPSVTTKSTLTTLITAPKRPWNCASAIGSEKRAAARSHTM